MNKFVFVHLYNDRSGSPRVLSQVLRLFSRVGVDFEVITSKFDDGFISESEFSINEIFYKRSRFRILTLIYYSITQVQLFFKCLRYFREDVIFYVNTLMPCGAAIAAKLMRKDVIYHVHEVSIQPPQLKNLLAFILERTASKVIFVSQFVKSHYLLKDVQNKVVYNSVSRMPLKSPQAPVRLGEEFIILMVCSLKIYKGINEFVNIAEMFSGRYGFRFRIVLNADYEEVQSWARRFSRLDNFDVFSRQVSLSSFYKEADLVLNLTQPDQCQETFGLTIVEAMSYGIPIVAPPIGGPVEIVRHNFNGFLISCYDLNAIEEAIVFLSVDAEAYKIMSDAALETAEFFSVRRFEDSLIEFVLNSGVDIE